MVSKRERLEAAIKGELADRPPVALWRHFPVADQKPELLARATLDFQQEFDFDFIKVTPASSFCLKDWGAEDTWRGSPEGTRDYSQRPIQAPSDWAALPDLDVGTGQLGAQLQALDLLERELGSEVPFVQTIFSPLAQAKNLAGESIMLEHLRRCPKEIAAGLECITRTTVAFVEAARQWGISGIFYAIQHASYRFLDQAAYSQFGEPFDQRILEAAAGLWLNIVHLHGDALFFDLAARLPAAVVNWHDREAGPSLAEGQKHVEGAVCGGLRRWETLVLGDPLQVRDEAEQALRSVASRGVVLGAGCVVPQVAPSVNLGAARGVVECV
jgi:uroporphyrinogen decarboxylase